MSDRRHAGAFIPARSAREASSRIFALTGREPSASRGPKRALVALAQALRLPVDMSATNSVLGEQIARELEVGWPISAFTRTGQITVHGINLLLEGAAAAFLDGNLAQTSPAPDALSALANFRAARSKIEAVNRISSLTRSGPEILGPGGKERKSVLVNLAVAVFPQIDVTQSKTDLGATLARALHMPWTEDCSSTGQTISLRGLNTILGGAERHLRRLGAPPSLTFGTPQEEGAALAAALREILPDHWDGRRSVTEMREARYGQWRHLEWPGFYNEYLGIPALIDTFSLPESGGPQRRFGHTTFDYALGWVWDLKVHTERKRNLPSGTVQSAHPTIILNDIAAAKSCIERQGLGFLVVGGESIFDETGTFDDWHRRYTKDGGVGEHRSNSGKRRRRKMAFTPIRCEAYWLENLSAMNAAIATGQLAIRRQGRQRPSHGASAGAHRPDKLHLDTGKSQNLLVGA